MKENIIYEANPLEALYNEYSRLLRLQETGNDAKPLELNLQLEETWNKITDIIHGEEEKQLGTLRERIKEIVKGKVRENSGGFDAEGKI